MDSEEIPIMNPDSDDPFIDEVLEGEVDDTNLEEEGDTVSIISEEIGGHNELPITEEFIKPSFEIGDTYIFLLESKDEPFLAKIVEIIIDDKILKVEDEKDKFLSFAFENDEIINKTDEYEILDMIRVKSYKPDEEEEEYKDIEFITEELIEKQYSDLAKKDDLLSAMIQSMDIYKYPLLIRRTQQTIDELLSLLKPMKGDKKLNTDWLIPVIDDNIKLYNDLLGSTLSNELNEEEIALSDTINNYHEYLNILHKYSKPIDTTNAYGINTNEFIGTFLRDCIQEEKCTGLNGEYMYDERRNSKPIYYDNSTVLSSNSLRFVGLLEEPINKHVYSINKNTLSEFNVFEKYLYNFYNQQLQYDKKNIMKNSLIVISTQDEVEGRDIDKFILHNVPENSDMTLFEYYRSMNMIELSDQIVKNDLINNDIYNYDDIKKLLFKYKIKYNDLPLKDRTNLDDLIKNNIKNYRKEYYKSIKSLPDEKIVIKKIPLTDEKRVSLSYDYIFKLTKDEDRKYYMSKFIELFTRSAEKETENNNYLYNKYTDKEILCKHYLYEVNIENDNDAFNQLKTKFGSPPEDGCIYCNVCGTFLCNEDTTLFDGYDNDKPMKTRETVDDKEEEKLMISEYLSEKEDVKKIIKLLSSSLGVDLEDKYIYEILLSYELLDHNYLADIRYDMIDVSSTDKHPRINNKIKEIKKLESKEKNKSKKKELKSERENVVKNFQRWLKDTNKILLLTALLSLFIQTEIPSFFVGKDEKKSFQLIDVTNKKIDNGVLKYLSVKIRRNAEKYKNEKIWNNSLELFNEKEYDVNEIETQLGLIVKNCMEPNFPKIVSRITKYEEYILSSKHEFIRDEWVMFRPLKRNTLVNNITNYLLSINEENKPYFKKVYGGNTIENSSLIRPITISKDISLSKNLEIPEIDIFKNNSFKTIFRYVVSLYGIHESNLFITLSFQRLLDTCDRSDEILNILKKYGWNESSNSFKELNFGILRKDVIPNILSLYGDKNTEVKSCYTNEKSCNSFIHNAINTYDLPLLNTYPKRIYSYKIPNIYPILPYGRLNEIEKYDDKGKKQPNIIDKLFDTYKYDELGDIIKELNDNFYLQFMTKYIHLDKDYEELKYNKYKEIERNEENFQLILHTLRKEKSLRYLPCKTITKQYDYENYDRINKLSNLDNRFYEYLEDREMNNQQVTVLFNQIVNSDNSPAIEEKITREMNILFSDLITEKDNNINEISNFLAKSDHIEPHQKKRFESIFKEYNPEQRIAFKSDQISSILNLFINDPNLKYNHLVRYITDIRNIFSHLINNNHNKTLSTIPKEWKCSDTNRNQFNEFMDRDGNSVHLFLHNKIYIKSKDNYLGFNRYINDEENNTHYFKLLFNHVKDNFNGLDKIKGSSSSKYNEKYSNIYTKYHFIRIFFEMISYINELKDSRSEVTSDANDLFQSLEQRDEDLIDDMIEVLSLFIMDLLTHVLFEHYDPSWLFLNEQKLDLANRLSKQKEREKQILIDKLDGATNEERFAMMQKQKFGLSNWHKQGAEQQEEYVKSDEYSTHTESERQERLKEILAQSNVELDFLHSQDDNEEVGEIPGPVIDPINEEEGYLDYENLDEENEEYMGSMMDEEQEQEYNE